MTTTEISTAEPATPELWIGVCPVEAIVPDTGVCARLGDRQVAIFRLGDDSVYALDNFDPFARANILSRGIVGDSGGAPKVASPAYKQSFDLRSGQCLDDDTVTVATFQVRVVDGVVQLAG